LGLEVVVEVFYHLDEAGFGFTEQEDGWRYQDRHGGIGLQRGFVEGIGVRGLKRGDRY
jgi:hypothetical protein